MSGAQGVWPSSSLALRSLLWTLLLPGLFAGYVPWRFFGLSHAKVSLSNPAHLLGILSIVLGAVLLGVCIVEFAQSGRGTLGAAPALYVDGSEWWARASRCRAHSRDPLALPTLRAV